MTSTDQDEIVENAVAEGGAYDIIRKRLLEQGQRLQQLAQTINEERTAEFGQASMEMAGRLRARTEHNCVARDLVRVGEWLLLGYNVNIALKKETTITDVFTLYRLDEGEEGLELSPCGVEKTFLDSPEFVKDFNELYAYYKTAQLLQLVARQGSLLACFQIGDKLTDIRVFRWSISPDGKIDYLDNRGEREIALPDQFDFEWIDCERSAIEEGRHPHVNILDQIFVDTIGGDLTIKVENNTKSGQGIYSEPVEDQSQSLDDSEMSYAQLGKLILLRVKPYREEDTRYLVFNSLTQTVQRIDAIGHSCVQLPEDHGIIFPGGIYLQSGEMKTFNDPREQGLRYKRTIRSPNGEDVLFLFYEPTEGMVVLYPYNLVEKEIRNPLYSHGYGLFEDGRLIFFYAEDEATRVHPMQIWQTPFQSELYADQTQQSQTFYGRLGNPELVRGISELYALVKLIREESVSSEHYSFIVTTIGRVLDQFYWFSDEQLPELTPLLKEIGGTAELVIDEYEKVASIRQAAIDALKEAEQSQQKLIAQLQPDSWHKANDFIVALDRMRKQQGHLITIRDYRYIDQARVDALAQALDEARLTLSSQTVQFLQTDNALEDYINEIDALHQQGQAVETIAELGPVTERLTVMSEGLDLLSEMIAGLKIDDATVRTAIIDDVSSVYSKLNQVRAQTKHREKSLGSAEAVAQFSAQFKLFSQSITNGLGLATTPDKCDEQLSRLLVQLEEFETQFSDHEQFLADILEKRDEVLSTFESHKQALIDDQQRRVQHLADAAARMFKSVQRRAQKFTDVDELNTFFASDPLVIKGYEIAKQLVELGDSVKADDLESQIKLAKDQAIRALRDKQDIFEDGGTVIKLGPRHRFNVNTQALDLTLIPRGDSQTLHITGTDYYEAITDEELIKLKPFWEMSLTSESETVYRAEYLAYTVLQAAARQEEDLSESDLIAAMETPDGLVEITRRFANARYKEGYEKGIHDHDAARLLSVLLPMKEKGGLLRFGPLARALGQLYWAECGTALPAKDWPVRAASAVDMAALFADQSGCDALLAELQTTLAEFVEQRQLPFATTICRQAAAYLIEALSKDRLEFVESKYASRLREQFVQQLKVGEGWRRFEKTLEALADSVAARWAFVIDWLTAFVVQQDNQAWERFIPEAAVSLVVTTRLPWVLTEIDVVGEVTQLLGEHAVIQNQTLSLQLDEFYERLDHHVNETIPNYERYLTIRHELVEKQKASLRLESFLPRPLSSFVRNRLINEAYLPLIGDNLAKQMGTAGESKRTDLMGLLMMISPPGYGKTTLMEYVASRLGLVFMKINCPSIGHDVVSLDVAQAPNATARQEIEKLNLGLEMGSNVMLYLDDIQHTNPEFLQKFISLCDGTRRIEGVWRGKTKTYDMRGKKFCVVMAGNPYTETGELFQIPDMLANRADIYNLGDVLSGMDEVFALSYIENCLTSNPVLAPLATREMKDVYRFFDMAKGIESSTNEFSHGYSGAEIQEIVNVLQKLFVIQDVVLKVNQQYIKSSSTADKYRTEPPFKLQGSYRNMNKMAEKVSSVMTDEELMQLIADHYQGESQLLTEGSEQNVLKLAELRGNLTEEESERWAHIKAEFSRNQAMGGDDADAAQQAVRQLVLLSEGVDALHQGVIESSKATEKAIGGELTQSILRMGAHIGKQLKTEAPPPVVETPAPNVEVINQPVPGIDKMLTTLSTTIENCIYPLLRVMDGKLDVDLRTNERMKTVFEQLKNLESFVKEEAQLNRDLENQRRYKARKAREQDDKPNGEKE